MNGNCSDEEVRMAGAMPVFPKGARWGKAEEDGSGMSKLLYLAQGAERVEENG